MLTADRMKLHISDDLSLPLDFVTQTQAILAKRGAGKTYTAAVEAEEMLEAKQQIVIIDPTGASWGLRSAADGKREGFPIVVLGGEHGDVSLEKDAGEVIAASIVENRFSAIVDLSAFRKGEVQRFMAPFLETLYRLNRQAMHLFVDEADAVAPQRPFGDEARTLGAMEDIVRRGRVRGIGCTLITQRASVLNKNVLTQCEVLCAMRLVHPRDIDAVMEWVNVHADEAQAKAMIESLPSLPIGTAWFWSPAMGIFDRVRIRQRRTFDSSATPKVGQKIRPPKVLAPIDIEQLGEKIKSTAEKARANDPAALKRRIAELEKQLAQRPKEQVEKTVEKIVEVPVLKNGQLDRTEKIAGRLEEVIGKVTSEVAELRRLIAPAAAPRAAPKPLATIQRAAIQRVAAARTAPAAAPVRSAPGDAEVGRGGLRRILIALAQRPGLTNRQIGVRAGLSSSSGSFGTYLSAARKNGWIQDDGDRRYITDAGVAALGDYDPLPSGSELLAYWLNDLGNSGVARILKALADAYPEAMTNDQLGEAAGMSSGSGSFGTYMSKLRTLELIQAAGKGLSKASDELFD